MKNWKWPAIVGLMLMSLLSVSGCGVGVTGSYQHEIRIKRGVDAKTAETLQGDLKVATARYKGFTRTLELMPGGRYFKQTEDRKYEGDWWIDDDGRLAFRCTHQNGRSLNVLVSKGADSHMEIGADGNLYRYWNNSDSNLEFVFVKQ